MNISGLVLSFLKVGFIGFGGGSALIPIVENEIVAGKKAMEEDEYIKHTVVANITPGALPVKLGATCGVSLCGSPGSVLSAWAVTLPGVALTLMILLLFSVLGEQALTWLQFASVGITVFIVYLLTHYILKTVRSGSAALNAVLCILAAVLTFGKEIRQILELLFRLEPGTLGEPVFNISMIRLMILSLYLIVMVQLGRSRVILGAAFVSAAAFAFGCGSLIGKSSAGLPLSILSLSLMAAALLAAILTLPKSGKKQKLTVRREIVRACAVFLAVPLLLTVLLTVTGLLPGSTFDFLGRTALSTVTSFGGGEAYIAVADGIFVQEGYVSVDMFYGQIVPVANALPGPILVKIASAVAFTYGAGIESSAIRGLCLASVTMLMCVGVCCAVALIVYNFYEALKDSAIILAIKRHILPVICGSLISVSLTMFYESLQVAGSRGFSVIGTLIVLCAGVAGLFAFKKRARVPELLLLVLCVAVSIAVFLFRSRL